MPSQRRLGRRPTHPKYLAATLALAVAALVGAAHEARAQIDPEPRSNLELGVEGPLRGEGVITGYAFYLWNRPHFLDEEHLYLRVILAPTYLTGELVRDRWPARGHALGVGLAGGYFPYSYDEFRLGEHVESESFLGHGGEVTVSYYYRRVKLFDVMPVEGQLRVRPQYVLYERGGDTDSRFRLPTDTPIYWGRAGIRLGGEPPELLPDLALEVSIWYEIGYRQYADPYGFPEAPLKTEHVTQQAWARAGGIFTPTKTQSGRIFFTAGTSEDPDPLSSYRMGSALRFRREFPLVLHGYYVDEIFAHRFWLLNVTYRFPLWPGNERYKLQLAADYARVDYLKGRELPRHGLRGVGADLTVAVTSWVTLILGYGYGFDAPRGNKFGGHEGNFLLEFKF